MKPALPAEKALRFRSGDVELDGRLFVPDGETFWGCVVCHPHPLYGGDMNSSVVVAMTAALAAKGVPTLRFDFRGVGASGGTHGEGVLEIGDARAAVGALQAATGLRRIAIAGYSFGALVALRMAAEIRGEDADFSTEVGAVVAVAPPLAMFDASFVSGLGRSLLAISGDRDDYCPRERFEALYVDNDPDIVCTSNETKLIRLPGTDHFFSGKEAQVGAIVADWVSKLGTFP